MVSLLCAGVLLVACRRICILDSAMAKVIAVNDNMQQNYHYRLTELMGKRFDPEFKPELTPK